MKTISNVLKAITVAAAAVCVALFFFDFVKITGNYSLTGFQMAFGSQQTIDGAMRATYKSAWYIVAFILSAATLLFSALNFKFKGCKYASFGFSLAAMINMLVIFFTGSILNFFDVRPLSVGRSMIAKEPVFLIAVIVSIGLFVLATATMLVADYSEVLESKGAKLTIFRRMFNFFKDNKAELKKIVWPSRQTVFKNVVVVIVMCVIVGLYIWALDYGLAELLKLILGIK